MRAIIYDDYTDIYPTSSEVIRCCKSGEGKNTCVWLLMSPEGWECRFYNKPYSLLDRWKKGQTNAKRDGCNKVKKFHPFGKELGKIRF